MMIGSFESGMGLPNLVLLPGAWTCGYRKYAVPLRVTVANALGNMGDFE